jgi:hypothetical protein
MTDDPQRWSELSQDLPDGLGEAVNAVRGDQPTSQELGELIDGVLGHIGAGSDGGAACHGGGTEAASGSAGGTAASTLPKLALVVAGAVATAGLIATVVLWRPAPHTAPTPAVPVPRAEPEPAPKVPAPAPSKEILRDEPTGIMEGSPVPNQPSQRRSRDTRERPSTTAEELDQEVTTGPSEATLLANARRTLRSDPAAALELTREHAQRFPQGRFIQEREVVAVDALFRLGRIRDGRSRAERFLSRYQSSIHRATIQSFLDDH